MPFVARVREGPTWVILDQSPPTRAELAALRDEMQQHYATKADLANLETRLTRWFGGIVLAIAIGIAGLIVTVLLKFI